MVCDDMQPSCSLPVHVFDQLQHGEQVLSLPRQLGTHSVGLASFFHFSFSAREANIVSNTDYTWRCPDYVPLPSNPVFYQINLPTYMEEECNQALPFRLIPRFHSLRNRHQPTGNHSITRSERHRAARSRAIQL